MRTVLFVMGGAAIGAGCAWLMSPQAAGTRSRIRDKAVKCSNDVTDFCGKKTRHFTNVAKGCAHQMEDVVASGRELIQQGKETVSNMAPVQEILEQGREVVEKAKTAMHKAAQEPMVTA
jgi:gas vesicle protein